MTLEEDPAARLGRDPELHVAGDAACLVRDGELAWLLQVDVQHARVLLVRPLAVRGDPAGRSTHDVASFEEPVRRVDETAGRGPEYHDPQGLMRTELNPSGRRVLTQGHDGTTRLWLTDGTPLAVVQDARGSRFIDGGFIAEGRFVTGTFAGTGELWDEGGASLGIFKEAGGNDLFVVAVSRDGQHFATTVSRSGIVELWDASGGTSQLASGRKEHVWSGSFSGDGRYLATGSADRRVQVWDWRERRRLVELHGHTATGGPWAFHPEDPGLLLSACHAGSVRVWTLAAPVLPALRGHGQGVEPMIRTPAGCHQREKHVLPALEAGPGDGGARGHGTVIPPNCRITRRGRHPRRSWDPSGPAP